MYTSARRGLAEGMFIREEVQVSTPAAVVRGWIADARPGGERIAIAAQAALAGGPGGRPGESSENRPNVTVEARAFSREQPTVFALRVFTTSDSQVIQPTLDVDLEIQPVAADATALVLTRSHQTQPLTHHRPSHRRRQRRSASYRPPVLE